MLKNGFCAVDIKKILLISSKIVAIFFLILFFLTNFEWFIHFISVQDFGSFYDSCVALINGQNPYFDSYKNVYAPFFQGRQIPSPNLNPPPFFILTPVFIHSDVYTSYRIWQIISIILFILSIILIAKTYSKKTTLLQSIIIFSFAGIWTTLKNGQIYFLLLLFLSLTLFFLSKKNHVFAGIFIGLICVIKPNFFIIILGFLFARKIKIFLSSLATSLIFYTGALAILGFNTYLQWFEATKGFTGFDVTGNSSIIGFFARMRLPFLGYILAGGLLILYMLIIFKQKQSIMCVLWQCVILSLMCSPVTWSGYTILLLPYFMVSTWKPFHWVAAIMLSIPISFTYSIANQSAFAFYTFGWIYGYALLIILFSMKKISISKLNNRFV